jgi:hypothetical protein
MAHLSAAAIEVAGRILDEDAAASGFRVPGESAVCLRSVHKEEDIAGLECGMRDQVRVVITGSDAFRQAVSGFVTAGHTRETTVCIGDVSKLPGYGDGLTMASPIFVDIRSRRVQGFIRVVE